MKQAMWVLWPSFLVGGVAEMVFFTLFDPMDLHVFGSPVELSRTAIYTHATRVVQAVVNEQASERSYEELWAENERLRAENQEQWSNHRGRVGLRDAEPLGQGGQRAGRGIPEGPQRRQ